MEDTKHIHISDYNYPLPEERIAKFPLPVRDQSKLLVYRNGNINETRCWCTATGISMKPDSPPYPTTSNRAC